MDILWGGGRKQDEDYGSSKSDFCIFLAPKQGFEFPALSSSLCVLLWGRIVWPQIIFTQCWVSYVIDVENRPWKLIVLTKIYPNQKSSWLLLFTTENCSNQKSTWPKIILTKNCFDQKLFETKIVLTINCPGWPKIVLTKNCPDQKLSWPKICLSKNLFIQKSYLLKICQTKNHPHAQKTFCPKIVLTNICPDQKLSQHKFCLPLYSRTDFRSRRFWFVTIFGQDKCEPGQFRSEYFFGWGFLARRNFWSGQFLDGHDDL